MHIYAAQNPSGLQKLTRSHFLGIGIAIISGVFLFILSTQLGKPEIITPLSLQAAEVPQLKILTVHPKDPEVLKKRLELTLDDSVPAYSLFVDDFLSPFHLELGNSHTYVGASVHKIPILTVLYQKVQEGKISLSDEIIFEEKDRQDYGTGSMRYDKAGNRYTIHELAKRMMRQSDNTAAYILANRILTMSQIQTTINSWGLKETSMIDNRTTNRDMNFLMRKLFTGRLLSASYTREAIDLFTDSDFEDRIPALLPSDVSVYHKIGSTVGGLHDVGIVVTKSSMYYIGIFTDDVSDEERATRAVARLSRTVYDFMEGK